MNALRLRRLAAASLLLAAGCAAPPASTPAAPSTAAPLTTIAFGSCSREDLPQPLWEPILAARPGLWMWLGDNVYGDTEDMTVMRAKYDRARANPGYARLVSTVPVVGTWDDHDYGLNNGGREFAARREAQRELLDFLGEPADSPRRAREGVYAAYTYGPRGRQVKVILLDTRYFRDSIGSNGTILGEAQWAWLEGELRGSTAQVHVIASSIQVVPEDHRFEKWANFPAERERLFRLIGETRAPGVVFVSGDRHIAEISRIDGTAAGYPLYDVTSSGLTHTWRQDGPETNRHRIGEKLVALNFGLLHIDWDASPVTLRFEIRDPANAVRLSQAISLRDLQPR